MSCPVCARCLNLTPAGTPQPPQPGMLSVPGDSGGTGVLLRSRRLCGSSSLHFRVPEHTRGVLETLTSLPTLFRMFLFNLIQFDCHSGVRPSPGPTVLPTRTLRCVASGGLCGCQLLLIATAGPPLPAHTPRGKHVSLAKATFFRNEKKKSQKIHWGLIKGQGKISQAGKTL